MKQRAGWTLKCNQTQYICSSLSVFNFHACLYLVLVRIYNYYKSLETASWATTVGLLVWHGAGLPWWAVVLLGSGLSWCWDSWVAVV